MGKKTREPNVVPLSEWIALCVQCLQLLLEGIGCLRCQAWHVVVKFGQIVVDIQVNDVLGRLVIRVAHAEGSSVGLYAL